jgi:hypothetical protein
VIIPGLPEVRNNFGVAVALTFQPTDNERRYLAGETCGADVNREVNLRAEVEHLRNTLLEGRTNQALILVYLADCFLRGVESVKEYAIAVDALGRPEDFDPKKDAIVRVEIHKLRRTLSDYYAGPGRDRATQLALAAGKYALELREPPAPREGPAPSTESTPDGAIRPRARMRLGAALAAAALLGALAFFSFRGFDDRTTLAPPPVSTPPPVTGGSTVRILCGAPDARVVDSSGFIWEGDRFFTGGRASPYPAARVHNTPDQILYKAQREGDFSYAIPLPPGDYEVRLHFAELFHGKDNPRGGGESSRLFNVFLNDQLVLEALDVILHAGGPNLALTKTFPGQRPAADGFLHLRFVTLRSDLPFINAIEILPGSGDRMLPLRIAAGSPSAVTDSQGRTWLSDRYVTGGRPQERTSPVESDSPQLFRFERFGRFEYCLPAVPDHLFTVRVWMAEQFFDPAAAPGVRATGRRHFDLLLNGQILLRDFSVIDAARGPMKAVERVFPKRAPDAQGNVRLLFQPRTNYPVVNALELVDEGAAK